MSHDKSLLVGSVALVRGKIKHEGQALLAARNELELHLQEHRYLHGAPFRTVSLIIRLGEGQDLDPEFGNIDRKNSELPVAIQLDFKRLQSLDREQLTSAFRLAMIEVLCDVAANFDLPCEFLDELR